MAVAVRGAEQKPHKDAAPIDRVITHIEASLGTGCPDATYCSASEHMQLRTRARDVIHSERPKWTSEISSYPS